MKSISIIPNKNILNVPNYHKESETKSHTQMLQEFCNIVGLDYTNYLNIYECLLAYGLIFIITKDNEYALTWLPKELNNEQSKELFDLEEFYSLFRDLEFIDLFNNGLGIYSNEKNKGKEVLISFYEQLKNYQESKMIKDRKKEEE